MSTASLPRRALHRLQDRLLRWLGNQVDARANIVQGMLHRDANESVSYWLQLVVAAGIATLGLVVGSAAVVIGAMLIAPLMGPIVGLAMGLATGSPFLVLRSSGRIFFSVVVAVGGAAAITLLLPFHELNGEIAGRTTPTVLDLVTAGFCSLAGVYAALRPGSETASTAAGTSIGISLVPPLCASGYGLGTLAWPIAGGAALLFLTNLVAIVAIGSATFVASGFNRVDVTTLERAELRQAEGAPIARLLAQRLARLFESKLGPALRFLMPFGLLALVYVPLRRALDEVAWEVKARTAVQATLGREPRRIVESRVQVARHAVEVVVVLLGTSRDAAATRSRLSEQIMRVAGVKPSIEVLAVPDANAFAGLESTLLTPHAPAIAPTPPPASPGEQLDAANRLVRTTVAALWPARTAGEVLAVALDSSSPPPTRVSVAHYGGALEPVAAETLAKALSAKLERAFEVVDLPVPEGPIQRGSDDLLFMAQVSAAAQASRLLPDTLLCLTRPDALDDGPPSAPRDAALAGALDRLLDRQPRVVTLPGADFSLSLVKGRCASPEPPVAAPPRPPTSAAAPLPSGAPAAPTDPAGSAPAP